MLFDVDCSVNIDLIYICFAPFVHFKYMYRVLNMEQWNFEKKKDNIFIISNQIP